MPVAVAIPIGILAAIAFLYACSYAYNWSFGAMLQAIIDGIKRLPRISLGFTSLSFDFLATPFEAVDHFIRHALGAGILAMEHVWNYAWGYIAHAITEAGEAIAGTAEDVYRTLDHFKRYLIPALIAAALGPLAGLAYSVRNRIRHAVAVAIAATLRELHRLEHLTVTKAAAVAGTLPLPRIGRIEHDLSSVERWIKARGKLLTVAGISALLIAALGRVGLGWTRCSKVGKVGKQLCGMDEQLLGALLADTLLIVGTVSLVEFAQGMQGVVGEFEKPVRAFWRAA